MIIEINREIIERYKSYDLSAEYMGTILVILSSLYENDFNILDSLDDSNKDRSILMLYRYLTRKGFLEYVEEDNEDDSNYRLTERAVEFINFYTTGVSKKEVPKASVKVEIKDESVESWINDWIELFPKGNVAGRYLRTKDTECIDRMKWFISVYGFSKDIIFQATRAYLKFQENSQSGHTFTRNTSYFIFKGRSKYDRTSDLATWCERVKNGEIEEESTDAFNKLV